MKRSSSRGILLVGLALALLFAGCKQGVSPPAQAGVGTTPNGVVDRAFSFQLIPPSGASGSWALAAGSMLPPGLELNSSGLLSGTPTAAGTFSFSATVGSTSTQVTVVIRAALRITSTFLANGFVDEAFEQTLTATGGLPAYTWSIVDTGADPPGLELTTTGPDVGVYSGTPTSPGNFTFTIRVTDTANAATPSGSADATFTMVVLGAPTGYVANSADNTVSLIDIETNTVTGTIPVGTRPLRVALHPAGTRVYVTNNGSNSVSVIDTGTNTVASTVSVGASPVGIHAPFDGQSVYVANQDGNTVSVIDVPTNNTIVTIPMPVADAEPTGVTGSPNGRLIFVSLRRTGQVVVINNDPASPAFHTIIRVLTVGGQPEGVAFSQAVSQLYVANSASDSVSVLDVNLETLEFSVQDSITVGTDPVGVAAGPDCNFVHVSNAGSNTLSVLTTAEAAVSGNVTTGSMPQQVAFTPDGRRGYVTNLGSNSVTIFDPRTDAVVGSVAVGSEPVGIAILADIFTLRLVPAPPPPSSQLPTAFFGEPYGTRVCGFGGTPPYTFEVTGGSEPPGLSMDDTGLIEGEATEPSIPDFPDRFTFEATLTDSFEPARSVSGDFLLQVCCIGIPPFGYVANFTGDSVTVINTGLREVETTIELGDGASPVGVAITPDKNRIYVTNFNSDNVAVIDGDAENTTFNTVLTTVIVGNGPSGVVITPDGSRVYVSNEDADTISVIETATNTVLGSPIAVGSQPGSMAITPDGRRLYVPNTFSGSVSVIDIEAGSPSFHTVVATIPVGLGPVGAAATPDGTRVYVTNQFSDSISVIATGTNTVTTTISVGDLPTGIAIDPFGRRAYVANQLSNNVSVIDLFSNTEIDTDPDDLIFPTRISVGESPDFIAITPLRTFDGLVGGGGRVYVTNFGSDNVSVISNHPGFMDDHLIVEERGTISVGQGPEGIALQ